ncbi:ankyrin repeat domain-containing protein [Roseofilum sp. Guam]|uniref:ankyrin repeat domain-containing protein n=1 Tax=Roseofilum sp. Guam TaxID=2821502 RepID=UPI001B11CAA2|nr:ankyrin repeat domain-containing protein [Roseofilum sp. Guam]MBP0027710.1 ankyrin repeat domain-containing protein [Roseofilum sp. Guam]
MSYLSNLISKGDMEKLRTLILEQKYLIKESQGMRAVSQAIREDKIEIVQLLIECGAEVNDLDNIHYSHEIPISHAAYQGNYEMVKLLIDSGAEVNTSDEDPEYWNPLMCGVSSGKLDVVQLLVEAGADVNQLRDGGNCALNIAASLGFQDIFEYLNYLSNLPIQYSDNIN